MRGETMIAIHYRDRVDGKTNAIKATTTTTTTTTTSIPAIMATESV